MTRITITVIALLGSIWLLDELVARRAADGPHSNRANRVGGYIVGGAGSESSSDAVQP